MLDILLLHGPNLNMLGVREPDKYGNKTLADINQAMQVKAQQAGLTLQYKQSNAEHELIDSIHQALGKVRMIIINPAAFTHTSVALRDALLAVNIPFIEVHLSNIHQREAFRQHSYFSDIARGVICGFAENSYYLALQAAISELTTTQSI